MVVKGEGGRRGGGGGGDSEEEEEVEVTISALFFM